MITIKMRPPVAAARQDRSFRLKDINAESITKPMVGNQSCDVAIVGGGYAALWTALRIMESSPDTQIVVLEADFCGSGASGRNGGQVHSWFAEIDQLSAVVGADDALMVGRATADAIDELKALQESGTIDMGLRLDGWLWTASSKAQEGAWDAAYHGSACIGEDRFRQLNAADILRMTGSSASHLGIVEDKAGSVHPAKLAIGHRQIALSKGIVIHERSPVFEIEPKPTTTLRTTEGSVSAAKVVLAANACLSAIPELHPYLYIVGSQVIATAPAREMHSKIGWTSGASICDAQHHVLYYQRRPGGEVIFGRGTGNIAYHDRIGAAFNRGSNGGLENLRELHRVYPETQGCRGGT